MLISLIASFATKPKRPTFVVAPVGLLPMWKDQIERMVPHLRLAIHYGPERGVDSF